MVGSRLSRKVCLAEVMIPLTSQLSGECIQIKGGLLQRAAGEGEHGALSG